jgi:hypothetical protein
MITIAERDVLIKQCFAEGGSLAVLLSISTFRRSVFGRSCVGETKAESIIAILIDGANGCISSVYNIPKSQWILNAVDYLCIIKRIIKRGRLKHDSHSK